MTLEGPGEPGAAAGWTPGRGPLLRGEQLQSAEEDTSVVSSYPTCGNLLGQPQETNTTGVKCQHFSEDRRKCYKNSKKVLKEESNHLFSDCFLEHQRCWRAS